MPPTPKTVTVLVNNNPVEMPGKTATGFEIKEKAGVPPDFTLYHRHGTHLEDVPNDTTIKLHENQEFVAVSGQDVS